MSVGITGGTELELGAIWVAAHALDRSRADADYWMDPHRLRCLYDIRMEMLERLAILVPISQFYLPHEKGKEVARLKELMNILEELSTFFHLVYTLLLCIERDEFWWDSESTYKVRVILAHYG
jgi:hypothetical protein